MKPHAFVAMPFGTKPGPDGKPIDFNRIYAEFFKPALEAAGCEVFRADEEPAAGDIRADMFQELLVADLVLADLTLDNPNVWYELGVRHALRARGVVLVQGPRPNQPFDIYTDRKLNYTLKDGALDPVRLPQESADLTRMVRATLTSRTRRKVSPVYQLLPHLEQPEWRRLLMAEDNEFSEAQRAWDMRMETARQKRRAGDVMLLAGETPTRGTQFEARRIAGMALMKMQLHALALEQLESALDIDPRDAAARERKAMCLSRLARHEEAREWVRRLTHDAPRSPEAWTQAGRVEKEWWLARWRRDGQTPEQARAAAADEDSSLAEAIGPYLGAFTADPSHYYSGVNALTLMSLRKHLGGEVDAAKFKLLAGGVQWACLAALERDGRDYWARACYAEYCLLREPLAMVRREYRDAMATANADWLAIQSTLQNVELLRDLQFRPEETAAALEVLNAELVRALPPFVPRQVFVFSGHMMDQPGRDPPRFPATMEGAAAAAIAKALADLGAGPQDLAMSQAAAGGDLLFLQACQQLGVNCEVQLPFEEPDFIERSVIRSAGGEAWRQRFFQVRERLRAPPRVMTDEVGPAPSDVDPFERCNLWLLYTALAWGPDKVRFICLWNGAGGDGPGGTQHMLEEVKRRTGRVTWIDTRTLL
jgi:tetratricopeptide (TPR) repeat protein